MLGKFLAKHPNIPPEDKWEGWMDVAKSLFNADDLDGARHAALQAIGICPRLGEAYVVLAQVKARTGERASDVLKLLETADSCAREPYGTHERNMPRCFSTSTTARSRYVSATTESGSMVTCAWRTPDSGCD